MTTKRRAVAALMILAAFGLATGCSRLPGKPKEEERWVAAALPSMAHADLAQLKVFDGMAFFVALISHGAISILVGLLFAVLLPMFPSRLAAFWGSLTAPLFWSALVWATLKFVNPALDARIDWTWFIASQVVFGLVAGYVVHHTKTVETMQTWPLAARAGLEVPGLIEEKEDEQ